MGRWEIQQLVEFRVREMNNWDKPCGHKYVEMSFLVWECCVGEGQRSRKGKKILEKNEIKLIWKKYAMFGECAIIYLRSFAIYNIYFSLPSFSLCQSLEQHMAYEKITTTITCHALIASTTLSWTCSQLYIVPSPGCTVSWSAYQEKEQRVSQWRKKERVIRFLSEGGKGSINPIP